MESKFNVAMTELLVMSQDQTDLLCERLKTLEFTDQNYQWMKESLINHMQFLQRGLAKTAVSEMETFEMLDKILPKKD